MDDGVHNKITGSALREFHGPLFYFNGCFEAALCDWVVEKNFILLPPS
jgi:hypothetical protein